MTTPVTTTSTQPWVKVLEIRERLATSYSTLPRDDISFLTQVVATYRTELSKNAPEKLQTFDERLESLDAPIMSEVLEASLRYLIFSPRLILDPSIVPSYLKAYKDVQLVPIRLGTQFPVRDTRGNVIARPKVVEVDLYIEYLMLKIAFQTLPAPEQERLMNNFYENITDERGICGKIKELSNRLVQNNPAFSAALQTYYAQRELA